MRKINFTNNEHYHIYNRGTDKRKIFLNKSDYFRFLHNLYKFNNEKPAIQFSRTTKDVGGRASNIKKEKPGKKLVNIICFCLMPNHFHLILEQLVDNGISKFMHKLGTGYAMAFNIKYKRTGTLFQGKFKAIHIKNETYLTHLSRYIHLNPVELKEKNWKESGIKSWEKANEFLENYRYSSYLDYIGKKNFPSITNRKLILEIFDNEKKYRKFVKEWLVKDLSNIGDLILE
jgi:putative transposase